MTISNMGEPEQSLLRLRELAYQANALAAAVERQAFALSQKEEIDEFKHATLAGMLLVMTEAVARESESLKRPGQSPGAADSTGQPR